MSSSNTETIVQFVDSFVAGVAATSDGERIFDSASTRCPPVRMRATGTAAGVGLHVYDPDFAVRVAELAITREDARALGYTLIAHLVCAQPRTICIELAAPTNESMSPLKCLRMELPAALDPQRALAPGDAEIKIARVSCWPRPVVRHPWLAEAPADLWALPALNVTDAEGVGCFPDCASESALTGFGTWEGSLRMAEVLIGLSLPSNSTPRVDLEAEPGFRGVAPSSCEISIRLTD